MANYLKVFQWGFNPLDDIHMCSFVKNGENVGKVKII